MSVLKDTYRTTSSWHRTGMLTGIVGAAVVLSIAGCASNFLPFTGINGAVANRWPGTTNAELYRGKSLYRDQCSGCHSLHSPLEYAAAQWDTLLPVMQRRAKTTETDRLLMLKYVMAHAKRSADTL